MKKKTGISLIVLIITMVVIIILATAIIVNIAQSNIINNANEAVVKQDFKTMQEELELYYADQFASTKGKFSSVTFNADETTTPSIYDVIKSLKNSKYDGDVSIVNGKIVLSEDADEKIKEWASETIDTIARITVTTADILANPSKYYGKEVEYILDNENIVATTSNNVVTLAEQYDDTTWKIFYADSEHIYLIASDTLKVSGEEYNKMFTDATEALTYLNTQSNWSGFVNSYADYAIGGPTITMFANSWNAKYPNNTITLTGNETSGWNVNGDLAIDLAVNDSLYWKQDEWYLLNSKAVGTTFYPMQVKDDYLTSNGWAWNAQYGGENQYYSAIGFRPVICLKNGIKLEEFGNELKLADLNEKVADATQISNNATNYYGKTVNYKTGNTEIDGETTWQILHSDGNNIYIIAKDYIPTKNAPATSSGYTVAYEGEEYLCFLKEVVNDYSGTSDITTSNPARSWLSDYLDSYSNSTTIGKATAYMMDTNLWGTLYKGENAKYAIGGPTIEMIVDSYNKTHDETSTVAQLYTHVNEDGYYIGSEENSTVGYVSYINSTGEYNALYIVNRTDKVLGYYIASPSAFINESTDANTGTVTYTKNMLIGYYASGKSGYDDDYNGGIWNDSLEDWGILGLRPVVCLEDNISLQEKSDGTYDIIK